MASLSIPRRCASTQKRDEGRQGEPLGAQRSRQGQEQIATQIREEVLHSARHPEARFQSRSVERRADGGYDLAGDLALHGVTRLLQARTEAVGSGQQLDLTLHQPDFEIVPFRAMMGTLKIQADVKIRIVTR